MQNDQGRLYRSGRFKKTSIPGIYAAGYNTSRMRSVSGAVAAGTAATAMINPELIQEKRKLLAII